jgi:DNA topoisomerase-1
MGLKSSRFGPFLGCSNYPECKHTRPLAVAEEGDDAAGGDRELGVDPITGETVFLKTGRFGVYVQLGEGEKPKRSSLPKGWSAPDMDLEKGLRLLRLPREVGKHPEDGKPILAGIGRFGPFVLHEGTYANLPSADEVFDVGLNRAVDLIATKRAGRRGGAEAAALKELGAHPVDGQPIRVLSGRYGPYIKHGSTNANVPRGADPLSVTLEQAVALIAEREAKGGGKKKPAKAAKAKAEPKTAAKKAPAKKATAKKTAAKKPAKATAAATDEIDDDEAPF